MGDHLDHRSSSEALKRYGFNSRFRFVQDPAAELDHAII
jgi:hypothetical protein